MSLTLQWVLAVLVASPIAGFLLWAIWCQHQDNMESPPR